MEIKSYKISIILVVLAFLTCACNRSPHKIVKADDIDNNIIEYTENIYYELFKACEQDSLSSFSLNDYVSPKMQQLLKNGKYNNLCTMVRENIGEITSIEIQDAVYFKNILIAYRYKMKGTLLDTPIEFRLILTIDNLVSSIGFYGWNDEYSHSTPQLSWAK